MLDVASSVQPLSRLMVECERRVLAYTIAPPSCSLKQLCKDRHICLICRAPSEGPKKLAPVGQKWPIKLPLIDCGCLSKASKRESSKKQEYAANQPEEATIPMELVRSFVANKARVWCPFWENLPSNVWVCLVCWGETCPVLTS